ncbi:MAG: pyruvate dehydrogenase (acetyl-transferring), homodimeric type, partial [Pseudomonadota bacterium]
VERWNLLNPEKPQRSAYFTEQLAGNDAPIIVATDYMKNFAEPLRAFASSPFYTLGTDGYGRSDTRDQLRRFFEVSREYIVLAGLKALVDAGDFDASDMAAARAKLSIDANKPDPADI